MNHKNKTLMYCTLAFILFIGVLSKPILREGKGSSSGTEGDKEDKKEDKGGSFICTALYKNNHVSKDDYRLMTLFGVLAVKAKKYEKDMMLYFTCMKHLMPYVEKKEKENKQFWNNLKIFFVCCIKNCMVSSP